MPAQIRHLCLWAPDLIQLAMSQAVDASPTQQLLIRLLSRSTLSRLNVNPLESLFDFRTSETMASLSACADGIDHVGQTIFRADPVRLVPDMDHLLLQTLPENALSSEEALALIAAFNELFAEEGMQLTMASPMRWYLTCNQQPAVSFSDLSQVAGQNIFTHMPSGKDKLFWTKLMNEAQMLFHHHKVNAVRQQNRLSPINSIWLWGNNTLHAQGNIHWNAVYANGSSSRGAAMKSGADTCMLPDDLREILNVAQSDVLIHYDALQAFASDNPDEALREFYRNWLRPAYDAVMNRQVATFSLLPDGRQLFSSTRKSLRQWWRRDRQLDTFRL